MGVAEMIVITFIGWALGGMISPAPTPTTAQDLKPKEEIVREVVQVEKVTVGVVDAEAWSED